MKNTIYFILGVVFIIGTATYTGNRILADLSINSQSSLVDAFGRQRTSNPFTLFESKLTNDKQPLYWDEVYIGSMDTSTYDKTEAAVTMSTDADGEAGIRQTFMRIPYQPGKSQLVTWTGIVSPEDNITKRYGYFNSHTASPYLDSLDGIYFKTSNDSCFLCIAHSQNGENCTYQGNWNVDKMDGTGKSGIVVDWTKSQIWSIDFGWLGYLGVRFGLTINGATYIIHEINSTNISEDVFMSTPNHSIRAEIRQNGAGSGSIKIGCSSVSSEGGIVQLGTLLASNTDGTHLDADIENTKYALIAHRLKDNQFGTVDIISADFLIHTASEEVLWELWLNPSVSGTLTYNTEDNSIVETAFGVTANTVTGGTRLAQGYANSGGGGGGNAGRASSNLLNSIRLGKSVSGERDVLVLSVMPIGGASSVDIEGGLTRREY